MQEFIFILIAGVVAIAIFAFIAKKYGADCIP
jgi:hypothetical protein